MAMIANNPKAAKKANHGGMKFFAEGGKVSSEARARAGEYEKKADRIWQGLDTEQATNNIDGFKDSKTGKGRVYFGDAVSISPSSQERADSRLEMYRKVHNMREEDAEMSDQRAKDIRAGKYAKGGKVNPFKGKEAPSEEKKEKKLPPWLYAKGEKSEGEKPKGKPFAKGGIVADGIAQRGKTKAMKRGGTC